MIVETGTCDIAELRSLFLFEMLSDEQLRSLCRRGQIEVCEPGVVFHAGAPATHFYVLLCGTITLSQRIGANELETTRTGQRGAYAGAWSVPLGDVAGDRYQATLRAVTRARLFTLAASDFAELLTEWFPMALHLLEGVFYGNRNTQRLVGERERLLALGSVSAGLTHELNNPAAAALRATALLREGVAGMGQNLALFAGRAWDHRQLETLIGVQEKAVEELAIAPDMTPLEASDREDELVGWLDEHDITGSYDLAPTLVQAGLDLPWLDEVNLVVGDETLEGALRWLTSVLRTDLLVREIEESTARITELVTAAKQYSQMNRAPYQLLDVHELLDSTLVVLSSNIGAVHVIKQYDRSLPDVPVYGAELNQVWTNLIDNALQAMDGAGRLTLRTSRSGDHLQVEIADTGPGVPSDIVDRIFEPFFTTKPVGQGTGLGLDISWRIVVNRHHGELSVTSAPGDTRFRVRLPLRDRVAAEA